MLADEARETLELAFDTKELRDLCERAELAEQQYGDEVAKTLQARLSDLWAADSATEIPAGNPTEISNDRMSIELGSNYRLILCANHPKKKGSLEKTDWSKVTRVKLLGVEQI